MTLGYLLFSFEGRIGRKAYWFWVALSIAAQLAAEIVEVALVGRSPSGLSLLLSLVVLYSSIAVAAKRWHDRDKSGWWSLIALVPVIGWVWAIVENGFLRGTHGSNRYGPDPLAFDAAPFR